MTSASTYNRVAIGRIWNLTDLPAEWLGYRILLRGDLDNDLTIDEEELDEIDWIAFSEAVGDFQELAEVQPHDSKLGRITLRRLREHYDLSSSRPEVLKKLGGMEFRPAETPVSVPSGPLLVGRTCEQRSICNLWNKYGKAVYEQSQNYQLPIETALAVFFVESKSAYDPATGLVIIRFEPHVFRRKSNVQVPYRRGSQREEWQNLERAHVWNAAAALLSCSYGLPQLMGFNWYVTKHQNVQEMVLAFQRSCVEQVEGFFNFVEKNRLIGKILNEDWRGFTRRYNGPSNVDVYSGRLIRALKVINTLKQDGAEFVA
jgi:hypothetical protein